VDWAWAGEVRASASVQAARRMDTNEIFMDQRLRIPRDDFTKFWRG
jgi:hypothetical protein